MFFPSVNIKKLPQRNKISGRSQNIKPIEKTSSNINSKSARVKVTYEVECDSISGQVSYGNLIDIVDVIIH